MMNHTFMKPAKIVFFSIIFSFCIFVSSNTVRASGPEVNSIGTFNGITFWLGYNFSFSENYNPESETYNWMFYIAPEGLYVGLTSVRSVYSGVDVNASGSVFYGTWAIPASKLSPPSDGQDPGLYTVSWDNMNTISGITITQSPVSASIPSIGPLLNFGLGLSVGPTFFRVGNSKKLEKAIQLNSILGVSLSLIPMPSFLPGVSLDKSGPGDTNLTGKDTGFYPVILWNNPATLSDINTYGLLGTIQHKLQENNAGTTKGTMSGELSLTLLDFFDHLKNEVNGNILSDFMDKYGKPGAPSGSTEVDTMIAGAEAWLEQGDQVQAEKKLKDLMDSIPFNLSALSGETQQIRPNVEFGFQIAYKNGYDWAVAHHTRDDDVLYSDKVITDYCATGTKTSISVTSKEIYDTLGMTYPDNPDDDLFEGETVFFNNSVENILSSRDSMDTSESVVIYNHHADHEFVQNIPMVFLSDGEIYLDHNDEKFKHMQYKKVHLPRYKVIFLDPDMEAVQGETVSLSGKALSNGGNTIVWEQVYGPLVTLTGKNTLTPSFTAPEVLEPSKLIIFDLIVDGQRFKRACVINVINRPMPVLSTIKRPIDDYITGLVVDGQDLMLVNFGEKTFQFFDISGNSTNTISLPSENPGNPLCGTSGQDWIWYTIYKNGSVYKIKKDGTGNVKAFDTKAAKLSGIAFDGTSLWVAEQNGDNSHIYKYTTSGVLADTFLSPVSDPSGLAFHDGYLWIADQDNARILKMNTNGKIEESFIFPGVTPYGLSFDNQGFLWGIDFENSKIYKFGQYPVAVTDQNRIVNEGETVILDGSRSFDYTGSNLTFQWVQTGGPSVFIKNATTGKASFIAPAIGTSGDSLTFLMSVKNDNGSVSLARTIVKVQDSALALTAEAGNNSIVLSGSKVELDGSASTDAVSYDWKLIQGPGAVIENPTHETTWVDLPLVDTDQTFMFQLVVTDQNGNKASDIVEYRVIMPSNLENAMLILKQFTRSDGTAANSAIHDLNHDGIVGIKDVLLFLQKSASLR